MQYEIALTCLIRIQDGPIYVCKDMKKNAIMLLLGSAALTAQALDRPLEPIAENLEPTAASLFLSERPASAVTHRKRRADAL